MQRQYRILLEVEVTVIEYICGVFDRVKLYTGTSVFDCYKCKAGSWKFEYAWYAEHRLDDIIME